MGWFSGSSNLNETVSLREDTDIVWDFTCRSTVNVELTLQLLEGEVFDFYFLTPDEYRNYKRGLVFKYITQLSYENIVSFSNIGTLREGKYHLVARLYKVQDGWESRSTFNIRFEQLQ